MKRACLDNNILIWGLRGVASPGQENFPGRAESLIAELDDSRAEMLVPAIVVAKFLAGVPKERHEPLLRVLNLHFQLPPFDTRAAVVAAQLFRDASESHPRLRDTLRAADPAMTNVKYKADMMILAIAVSRKVDVIYTHDSGLKKLAAELTDIEVRDVTA